MLLMMKLQIQQSNRRTMNTHVSHHPSSSLQIQSGSLAQLLHHLRKLVLQS